MSYSFTGKWCVIQHWEGKVPYSFTIQIQENSEVSVIGSDNFLGIMEAVDDGHHIAMAITDTQNHSVTVYHADPSTTTTQNFSGILTGTNTHHTPVHGQWFMSRILEENQYEIIDNI